MRARQQWLWATALGLHFSLVLTVALEDFASTLAHVDSLLPASCDGLLDRTARITSTLLGRGLAQPNLLRQLLSGYPHATGIEAGYSYFAPNVPPNSKLVFELHYPDGQVQYDLPVVGGAAAGDRVAVLLDHLNALHYARLREAIVSRLVLAMHREHPGAVMIRAILGEANLPSPSEYREGKRTSYQTLSAYSFRFPPPPSSPDLP